MLNFREIVDINRRQALLLQELSTVMDLKSTSVKIGTPFAVLVKKLQESLTRMESFEVTTVSPGLEGKFSELNIVMLHF